MILDDQEQWGHAAAGPALDTLIVGWIMDGVPGPYSTDLAAAYTALLAVCARDTDTRRLTCIQRWRFELRGLIRRPGEGVIVRIYDGWYSSFDRHPTLFGGAADDPALAICRALEAWAVHHRRWTFAEYDAALDRV